MSVKFTAKLEEFGELIARQMLPIDEKKQACCSWFAFKMERLRYRKKVGGTRDFSPGPRRPRHLVLLGPLAALDPRLARGDARTREVLSDQRAVHGPRHHHPLGRPDGDLRPVQHGRGGPVQGRLHPSGDPGRQRQADVEVGGQRRSTRSTSSTSTAPTRCGSLSPRSRPRPRTSGFRSRRPSSPTAARSTPPSDSSRPGPSPTRSGTPRGSPS